MADKPMNLRVPEKFKEEFAVFAKDSNRSVNKHALAILEKELNKFKKEYAARDNTLDLDLTK